MILLQFIFLLYSELLCNSTEILQKEGFMISSEDPPSAILSRVLIHRAVGVHSPRFYRLIYFKRGRGGGW